MTRFLLSLFLVAAASTTTAMAKSTPRHLMEETNTYVRRGSTKQRSARKLTKSAKGSSLPDSSVPDELTTESGATPVFDSVITTGTEAENEISIPLSSKKSGKGSSSVEELPEEGLETRLETETESKKSKKGSSTPSAEETDTRDGNGSFFSIQIDLNMTGSNSGETAVRVEEEPEDSVIVGVINSTFTNETFPTEIVANSTYIKLLDEESSCMVFNETALAVLDCEEAGDAAFWEIVESEDPTLFQVRHVESQLCIPENPEYPDRAFNCWISEDNQAIGDTINGLVDCSSPFAAFLGFIDPANPAYLYNAICTTGDVGASSDVVLMAYTVEGTTQLLWGEKILLDAPQMTANASYVLSGNWFFEDA